MEILFVSGTCSKKKYEYIYNLRDTKMLDPSQKFYDLLINGMCNYGKVNIKCLSAVPISASCTKRKIWGKERETISKNLEYLYLGFINGKVLRYLTLYVTCFVNTCKWAVENRKVKDKVIICDPLVFICSTAARLVSKVFRIRNVAIVTDIPTYATSMKQRKSNFLRKIAQKAYEALADKDVYKYDSYILIVETMSSVINKNKHPFLIIEGSVDKGMEDRRNTVQNKNNPRVVMYAGGVYEKFGVGSLVRAFQKTHLNNIYLHIYGDGTYVNEVKDISKKDPRIKYMGILPVDIIVEKEMEATLLVNPRPSNEAFTKYSFPSKTLEYMVSGTPVLTTRLPGIPKEYNDYLFYFESEDEMARKLEEVLSLSDSILNTKGEKAKEFVLSKKNNFTQGHKIIDFIYARVLDK